MGRKKGPKPKKPYLPAQTPSLTSEAPSAWPLSVPVVAGDERPVFVNGPVTEGGSEASKKTDENNADVASETEGELQQITERGSGKPEAQHGLMTMW